PPPSAPYAAGRPAGRSLVDRSPAGRGSREPLRPRGPCRCLTFALLLSACLKDVGHMLCDSAPRAKPAPRGDPDTLGTWLGSPRRHPPPTSPSAARAQI